MSSMRYAEGQHCPSFVTKKESGIASRIESIDFKEMSITLEKHVERQKLEGQEQASGSKGLEETCGYTLTFDNSGNGGLNKDLGHKCFEKVQNKCSGKDFANEYSEGIQHERFGDDCDEKCKTLFLKRKQSKKINAATGFFHRDVSHESNVKERKTFL